MSLGLNPLFCRNLITPQCQILSIFTKCLKIYFSKSWIIQYGFIWKETMQLVSGKVEFNACQITLLRHNSFLGSLWTFQPPSYFDTARWTCQFRDLNGLPKLVHSFIALYFWYLHVTNVCKCLGVILLKHVFAMLRDSVLPHQILLSINDNVFISLCFQFYHIHIRKQTLTKSWKACSIRHHVKIIILVYMYVRFQVVFMHMYMYHFTMSLHE